MQSTFYWHDYETWGADPSRDRPAQFAGIRTDWDLNVIGDPLMIYSQPTMDMLPHPQACLITGITPQLAQEKGVPECEFIRRIHDEMVQPGTCVVGYNNLRFDDEITRFTLYRNFYDPYAREWQNGNSRWDIIDMARMCYALRPDGINWPRHEDGKPSFRLEELTAANGIGHESAHDALSDVHATIAVAKLIKSRQPRLYDYVLAQRNKHQVAKQLGVAVKKPLLHVSSKYSAEHGCTALVLPLAPHPTNKNGVIVYDLSADPQPLIELGVDEIAQRIFIASKDLPEGMARIPLKTVHLNRCPVIAPVAMLDDAQAQRLQIDTRQCRRHYDRLLQALDMTAKIQDVFASHEHPAITDPDRMLYSGGFASDQDRMTMAQLRTAQTGQLTQSQFVFEEERFNDMLFRYRGRNFPGTLDAQEQEQWSDFCYQRLSGEAGDAGITLESYQEEIDELRAKANTEQNNILDQLLAWGDQLL